MPSKFRLRRVFRGVVLAIARPLVRKGVRPDTVTYVSLFTAFLAFFILLVTHSGLVYGCLVFITGLLDGVDGAVARLGKRNSPAGPFIDSVIDKVSETMIILAIALAYPTQLFYGISVPVLSVLCLSGWLLTSYTRSRAEVLGVNDLNIGLGARSERLFTLFVFSVFGWVVLGLAVVTILGLLTAAYRYYHYTHEIMLTAQQQSDTA